MKKILFLLGYVLFSAASILAQESVPIFHQEITWSPDGKSLSFTTYRKPDPKSNQVVSEVYVIKIDGTGLQRLAEDAAWTSWSKDGRRILFSRQSDDKKSANVFSVRTDGSGLVQLTNGASRNTHPANSPNGKMIAYSSSRESEKIQIYVMKANGSDVRRLTTDSNVVFSNPMWSPDSKKLVCYVEKGDQKDQIWSMNADGSNQTLLTGNVGHNIYPAWSSDGKRIIFSSNRDGGERAILTMKADGSDVKRLIDEAAFFARYSPDGTKVAYILGRFPQSDVFIANADGSNPRKLVAK